MINQYKSNCCSFNLIILPKGQKKKKSKEFSTNDKQKYKSQFLKLKETFKIEKSQIALGQVD